MILTSTAIGSRSKISVGTSSTFTDTTTPTAQLEITGETINGAVSKQYSAGIINRSIHIAKKGVKPVGGDLNLEASFTNQELLYRTLFGTQLIFRGIDITKVTFVTANYTAGGGTLNVKATNAFLSSGTIAVTRRDSDKLYIGYERLTYSAKSATTFTTTSGDYDHVIGDIVFQYNASNDTAYSYIFIPKKTLSDYLTLNILRDLVNFNYSGVVLNSINEIYDPNSLNTISFGILGRKEWYGSTLAVTLNPLDTVVEVEDIANFPLVNGVIGIGTEQNIEYLAANPANNRFTLSSGVTNSHSVGEPVYLMRLIGNSLSHPTIDLITNVNGTLTYKGRSLSVLSLDWSLLNNYNDSVFAYGNQNRAGLSEAQREIKGTLNVSFDDLRLESDYRLDANDGNYNPSLTLIAQSDTLISGASLYPTKLIYFSNIRFEGHPIQIDSKGVVNIQIPFVSIYDDILDLPEIFIALTNNLTGILNDYTITVTEMKKLITFTEAGDYTPDDATKTEQASGTVHLLKSTINDEFADNGTLSEWTQINNNGGGFFFEHTSDQLWIKPISAGLGNYNVFSNNEPHIKDSHTGDFDIETYITTKYINISLHERCFLAVRNSTDASKWFAAGFGYWDGFYKVGTWENNGWRGTAFTVDQTNIYLRLVKVGNNYSAYYKKLVNDAWLPIEENRTNAAIGNSVNRALVGIVYTGNSSFIAQFEYIKNTGGATIDDFADESLNAMWTSVTSRGRVLEGTDGKLEAVYGGTATDYYGATKTGPFLYKTITGNGYVETKLAYSGLNINYEGAGLFLQGNSDTTDWAFFGMLYDSTSLKLYLRMTSNNISVDVRSLALSNTPVWLYLDRIGDVLIAYYKVNENDAWTIFSSRAIPNLDSVLRVGAAIFQSGNKGESIQFEYIRGGQYNTSTAGIGETAQINPGQVVVSIDSVIIYSTGSGGTCIATVQYGARGSDPSGWTEISETVNANPYTMTLTLTGDYDARMEIQQTAASTTDRGRDIDCIEWTYQV